MQVMAKSSPTKEEAHPQGYAVGSVGGHGGNPGEKEGGESHEAATAGHGVQRAAYKCG